MARARSRRRPAPRGSAGGLAGWWRRRSGGARVAVVALPLGFAVLVGVNVCLQRQPPRPDAGAVHSAIAAGRSGTEVTFDGTLVADPVSSGGHERMSVRDGAGDVLELDYNLSLGRWVPVHAGSTVVVHGQLYVDPGQAGVHCLHGQTSRGCPEPGWIRYAGATYS